MICVPVQLHLLQPGLELVVPVLRIRQVFRPIIAMLSRQYQRAVRFDTRDESGFSCGHRPERTKMLVEDSAADNVGLSFGVVHAEMLRTTSERPLHLDAPLATIFIEVVPGELIADTFADLLIKLVAI